MGSEVITLYYAGARSKKVYSTPHPPNFIEENILFRYDAPTAHPPTHHEDNQEGAMRMAQNENTGEYCIIRRVGRNQWPSSVNWNHNENYGFMDLVTNDFSWGCSVPFQNLVDPSSEIRNIVVCDVIGWDEDMFLIVGSVVLNSQPDREQAFRAFITGSQNKNIDKTFNVVRMDIYTSDNIPPHKESSCLTGISQTTVHFKNPSNPNGAPIRHVVYTGVIGNKSKYLLSLSTKHSYTAWEAFPDKHNGLDASLSRHVIKDTIDEPNCVQPTRPVVVTTRYDTSLAKQITTTAYGFERNVKFHRYGESNGVTNRSPSSKYDFATYSNSYSNGYFTTSFQNHSTYLKVDGKYELFEDLRYNVYCNNGYFYNSRSGKLNSELTSANSSAYSTNNQMRRINVDASTLVFRNTVASFHASSFMKSQYVTYVLPYSTYDLVFNNINGSSLSTEKKSLVFYRSYISGKNASTNTVPDNRIGAHSLFHFIHSDPEPLDSFNSYNHKPSSFSKSLGVIHYEALGDQTKLFPVQAATYCDTRYKGPGSLTIREKNGIKFNMGKGLLALTRCNGYYHSADNQSMDRVFLASLKVYNERYSSTVRKIFNESVYWYHNGEKFAIFRFDALHEVISRSNDNVTLYHYLNSTGYQQQGQTVQTTKTKIPGLTQSLNFKRRMLNIVDNGRGATPASVGGGGADGSNVDVFF